MLLKSRLVTIMTCSVFQINFARTATAYVVETHYHGLLFQGKNKFDAAVCVTFESLGASRLARFAIDGNNFFF